jgi:hypothetical protein
MRNALLTTALALLAVLPCTPAMALKAIDPSKARATVEIVNQTGAPIRARVTSGRELTFYDQMVEPGASAEVAIPVVVQEFRVGVSTDTVFGQALAGRRYSTPGSCGRITVTLTAVTELQLSDLAPCTAEEPEPPPEVPPPQASAAGRESLLAALSSSGLLALVFMGLLINRHE